MTGLLAHLIGVRVVASHEERRWCGARPRRCGAIRYAAQEVLRVADLVALPADHRVVPPFKRLGSLDLQEALVAARVPVAETEVVRWAKLDAAHVVIPAGTP